jgi:hypothetical protein
MALQKYIDFTYNAKQLSTSVTAVLDIFNPETISYYSLLDIPKYRSTKNKRIASADNAAET